MSDTTTDPELHAMQQVLNSLQPLDEKARNRVLAYVFQRLELSAPTSVNPIIPPVGTIPPPIPPSPVIIVDAGTSALTDIRSLKDAKQPKSDSQMAALVAYYLKYHAPAEEKKDAINTADIEKYFVQANYPLPKQPRFTLQNAKNGGYFDPAGTGFFKLNPVGHNLVAHGMGTAGQSTIRSKKAK